MLVVAARLLKLSNMPTEVVNKRCVWNAWLLWHCVADCFTEWAGLVYGWAVWRSGPIEIPLIPFCLHGDGAPSFSAAPPQM